MTKTNAMRILDSAKIEYTPYEYVPDDNDLTGVHVASQIGLCPDFVFKTLVARGDKGDGRQENRAFTRKGASFKHGLHKRRLQSHRNEKTVSDIY